MSTSSRHAGLSFLDEPISPTSPSRVSMSSTHAGLSFPQEPIEISPMPPVSPKSVNQSRSANARRRSTVVRPPPLQTRGRQSIEIDKSRSLSPRILRSIWTEEIPRASSTEFKESHSLDTEKNAARLSSTLRSHTPPFNKIIPIAPAH
jgi:hypothetical protein